MKSTTCGEPSPILLIACTGIPIREIAWAVPLVAMIRKPRSPNRVASWVAAALSRSVTGLNTLPAARPPCLPPDKVGSLQTAARSQQVADNMDPARRGTIVDRHGVELAVS